MKVSKVSNDSKDSKDKRISTMECLKAEKTLCVTDSVTYSKKTKELTSNGKQLHIHYEHNEIAIASPVLWSDVSSSDQISEFVFPPPLNALLYPNPVYIIRFDRQSETLLPLTFQQFSIMCERMISVSHNPREKIALYDVPAVPFASDANEASEDEEDDGDDTSEEYLEEEEEDDQADEDDEEWEQEDDDLSNVQD